MSKTKKHSIKINIIFSKNLNQDECNDDSFDMETRTLVDNLVDKYIGFKIKFLESDLDPYSNNSIFIKLSATTMSSYEDSANLEQVASMIIRNLERDIKMDKLMSDYHLEDMDWEIIQFG